MIGKTYFTMAQGVVVRSVSRGVTSIQLLSISCLISAGNPFHMMTVEVKENHFWDGLMGNSACIRTICRDPGTYGFSRANPVYTNQTDS